MLYAHFQGSKNCPCAIENVKRMYECVGVDVELRLGREKRETLTNTLLRSPLHSGIVGGAKRSRLHRHDTQHAAPAQAIDAEPPRPQRPQFRLAGDRQPNRVGRLSPRRRSAGSRPQGGVRGAGTGRAPGSSSPAAARPRPDPSPSPHRAGRGPGGLKTLKPTEHRAPRRASCAWAQAVSAEAPPPARTASRLSLREAARRCLTLASAMGDLSWRRPARHDPRASCRTCTAMVPDHSTEGLKFRPSA